MHTTKQDIRALPQDPADSNERVPSLLRVLPQSAERALSKGLAVLAALGLVLASAGCGATRSSRVDVGPEKGSDAAIESKLEMFDPRVVSDGTARRLELTLHNTSAKELEFLFTVDWLDRNGQPVPLTARRWVRVTLDADASRALRIEGMPPEATSFQLRYASGRK